ncbi:hypothetical protein HBH70_183480 [Parastagonospora nodorum]|nr:hypothetical protein HBH52_199550 [Parastagonospora nodorum]KAH4208397.1 hypothetical protein HBI95_090120 [Parastagonospora nodorum]KAH5130802.1 hypothetical protein HBH70_183480 [Parastagonospora nodorum]KAH5632429.1 hypothetical protein HBI51_188040 [Parastagonospora nodorum]KAH5719831.1 hypothetical protein HBI18_158750 [Parastagonospora nodorum]
MSYTYVNVNSCLYTSIALLTLAVVAVFARIALRARTARKAIDIAWGKHLDDLFCLLALVPTIGVSVVLIYGAKKGIVGSHNDPTNIEGWIMETTPTLVILEKLVYIIFIMQPLALGLTKLAFLFFYRRIFVTSGFQWTSLVFIILTIGFTLAFFFGFVFDCRLNFAANWGSLASISENCPFGFQATIIFTCIDAALDFFILILPLPWIWRLQMPTVRKIQLIFVFLLGGFAVGAALVRMVICIKQGTPSDGLTMVTIMGMPTYDIIGITSHGLFWTMVETNIALIACCLPTLRPILSLAAFGTALASLGSLLQGLGSALGSTRSRTTQNSSSSSKFSKFSKSVSLGSRGSSSAGKKEVSEIGSMSEFSLVEPGKPEAVRVIREKAKTPDPYDVYEMDLDMEKYGRNESHCDAV